MGILSAVLSGVGQAGGEIADANQKRWDAEASDTRKSALEEQRQVNLMRMQEQIKNAPLDRFGKLYAGLASEQVPDNTPAKVQAPVKAESAPEKSRESDINSLVAAITGVESGGNPNAKSVQGASGSMQIMPATFKQYAQAGESYDNDKDRRAAAIRKIESDYDHFGGDVSKVAAAYIGGRGAVSSDGSIRSDVADALGTTPLAYAERVLSKMRKAQKSAPKEVAQEDVSAAPIDPSAPQKMRNRTASEAMDEALDRAQKSGDMAAFLAGKASAGEKYQSVPEGGLLNTRTGEIVSGGRSREERDNAREDARNARQDKQFKQQQEMIDLKARAKNATEQQKTDPWKVFTDAEGKPIENLPSGEDFLAMIPTHAQNQVKALAEGRQAFPSGAAFRSPAVQNMLNAVAQYDPTFDAVDYNKRNKTATYFSSGVGGQKVTAINQAIAHMGELSKAIDELDNYDGAMTSLNKIANPISKAMGDDRQGNFEIKRNAVASELRKVFAGPGGGSLTELQEWQDSIPRDASHQQQRAYLAKAVSLLNGAIEAQQNQYESGMGRVSQAKPLVTAKSQATLDMISGMSGHGTKSDSGTQKQASAAPAMPGDISDLLKKYGG